MRVVTAVGAVLAALAWSSGALAGTLTESGFDGYFHVTYTFTAAAGETNAVSIQWSGSAVVITDTHPITLSNAPQCSGSGTNSVQCSDFQIADYEVTAIAHLGDMNDSIALGSAGTHYQVDGGPGDDTLDGPTTKGSGGGYTTLNGNEGNDTLSGGGGNVSDIYGPSGSATLNGDAGDDTPHGTPGHDLPTGGHGGGSLGR